MQNTFKPLHEIFLSKYKQEEPPSREDIMRVWWSLISRGLAYVDLSQSNGMLYPANYSLVLTNDGFQAAKDEEFHPDNEEQYLKRLNEVIPEISTLVKQYVREAVLSYNKGCYLANAVMLGVASEAAFLEMACSFGGWLPKEHQTKFFEILDNTKQNYITKFTEFRKRVETHKNELPPELSDGMELNFNAVLDLLRIYRNDAGHPTGKKITREDAYINLQMFARYLQKMYQFKTYFDSNKRI